MKKLICVILVFVMAFGCLGLSVFAAGENVNEAPIKAYGYVTPSALNVRSGPDTQSERIGGVTEKQVVFILAQEGDWYKINYKGVAGYVIASGIFYLDDMKILSFCTYSDTFMEPLLSPSKVPVDSPARTGYTFLGWSLTKGSDKVDYRPGDAIPLTESTVLFAVWQAPSLEKASPKKVSFNSDVTVFVTAEDVPYGCRLDVNGSLSEPQEAGIGHLSHSAYLGKLNSDCTLIVRITDSDGKQIDENLVYEYEIKVDNSFFGKIMAYIRYIFSGFKWPAATIIF